MLKVLIIEDERLTALDLAETLRRIDDDIEVVAILPSVQKSLEFFQNPVKVDLIFSDIQLPDGLSFDIFRNSSIQAPVIFCTAYDQYALEAFDVNGIDYLLKPFSKASVSKALDKYQVLKSRFSDSNSSQLDLINQISKQLNQKSTSVIVHKGDKIIPLKYDEIALFYLEDNYVFALSFDQKKHILSYTLEELESTCGVAFFRANRQYLVNRKAIKEAERYLNRKILIHLNIQHPGQILVGKLKTSAFLNWITNS